MITADYLHRLRQLHQTLGIPSDYARTTRLSLYEEAVTLVETEPDVHGRVLRLTPAALAAWQAMKQTAAADDVVLHLVSAFRSVDYQAQLIRRKLEAGRSLEQILLVNAAPGYSEHHTGRAIDIGTPGCADLEEAFEDTPAFAWLMSRGAAFGFTLSYPRDNHTGICYEPWHWCCST